MTNSNHKARIRAYMQAHGVNYTTARRRLGGAPAGPLALVRETWPIPEHGVWDGDYLQVVVDCPFCAGEHRHGGRVSNGRNHGERSPHCNAVERAGRSYTIYDARERQTISQHPMTTVTFDGEWPGDPEPTVKVIETLIKGGDQDAAIEFLRTSPGLPPVTLRAAWSTGLGWDGDRQAEGAQVIVDHPSTPDDIRADAIDAILGSDSTERLLVLAASPGLGRSGHANRLITDDCGSDHRALYALAANPTISADTLGWISEHATGFLDDDVDAELTRLILAHPNIDDVVWGLLQGRVEYVGHLLIDSPRCKKWVVQTVFDVAAESVDPRLAARAAAVLVSKGDPGYLTRWLADRDEYADPFVVATVQELLDP